MKFLQKLFFMGACVLMLAIFLGPSAQNTSSLTSSQKEQYAGKMKQLFAQNGIDDNGKGIFVPDILVATNHMNGISIEVDSDNRPTVHFLPVESYENPIKISKYRFTRFDVIYGVNIGGVEASPLYKKFKSPNKAFYIASEYQESQHRLLINLAFQRKESVVCFAIAFVNDKKELTDRLAQQLYKDFSCTYLPQ